MKTCLKRILPVCLGLALFTLSAAAQSRVATIDLRKVFDGYWKTKQADAALKERAAGMDKDHKALLESLNKAKEEYESSLAGAKDQAISADEREKRKKAAEGKLLEIRESEQQIVQFERQARTTLDEQRKRMREDILKEIRATINSRAKAAGHALVFDIAAESINNTPVVLYTNGENDLTEVVLSHLNANAPAGLATGSKK